MSAWRTPSRAATTPAALTRRHLLAAGFCLCCLPSRTRAAPLPGPFATDEVAPGIHIRRGLDEEATADNGGAIANIGFIVGREAVLVTDPGGSLAGEAGDTHVPAVIVLRTAGQLHLRG